MLKNSGLVKFWAKKRKIVQPATFSSKITINRALEQINLAGKRTCPKPMFAYSLNGKQL